MVKLVAGDSIADFLGGLPPQFHVLVLEVGEGFVFLAVAVGGSLLGFPDNGGASCIAGSNGRFQFLAVGIPALLRGQSDQPPQRRVSGCSHLLRNPLLKQGEALTPQCSGNNLSRHIAKPLGSSALAGIS